MATTKVSRRNNKGAKAKAKRCPKIRPREKLSPKVHRLLNSLKWAIDDKVAVGTGGWNKAVSDEFYAAGLDLLDYIEEADKKVGRV